MKKISIFLLAALISMAPLQKAQAGVLGIMGAIYHDEFSPGPAMGMVGLAAGVAGLIVIWFNPLIGAGLLVLDGDGANSQAQAVQGLEKKFPFIEDHQVVSNLATYLTTKLEAGEIRSVQLKDSEGQSRTLHYRYAELSEGELRTILAPADLSELEVKTVIAEFEAK